MSLPKFNFDAEDVIKEGRVTRTDIEEIKEWMITSNLPMISDEMIITFLIACMNKIINTKNAISTYFLYKNDGPELFNNRDIDSEELKLASNTVFSSSIPVRTDENFVVHFFKLNDTYYGNFNLIPIMKLAFMLIDITLNKKTLPDGLKVVLDAQGGGLMHLTRVKIGAVKKFIQFLQDSMPLRMTEIHIINTMPFADKFLMLAKPFMNKDLYKVLNMHPNNTDMEGFSQKFIPKKCLPSDYGGELPSFAELNEKTIERYRELKTFFEEEEIVRQKINIENKIE